MQPPPGYRVIGGIVPAGSGVTLLARVIGQLGQPITPATLTSISYAVTDLVAGTVTTTGTFSVSGTVFGSLVQNDPRWPFDSVEQPSQSGLSGYNFLATLASTTFALATPSAVPLGYPGQPPAARLYQVDVTFVPVAGNSFKQGFRAQVVPSYG